MSLYKGARVIVTGRLRQYTIHADGEDKRTVIELDAEEVGASLRFCSAKIMKFTNAASHGDTAPTT